MARIDLIEPYAVRFARQSIRDSLMSHGEECILFKTYHVNEDQDVQPRCPVCWDDVYEQNQSFDCDRCYGTGFDLGVKHVFRAWAIFTDAQDEEQISSRGYWHPQDCNMQTEHIPDLWQRDYVARISGWTADHRPTGVEGFYVLKQVTNESLRTGNRIGQTSFDNVGQRADVQHIAKEMPICKFPIIGQVFHRYDGRER